MKSDAIGVIGLGFLGRGIAASLLGAGLNVVVFDTRQEAYQEAHTYIEGALQEMVRHGNLSSQAAATWQEHYTASDSMHALKICTFVIESIVEDLVVKHQVFDEIEIIVDEDVPIASNTSALPITVLQRGRRQPSRFLGMHWTEPAYATRFLEIILGEQTSDTALDAAMELALRIGKDACVVRQDVPGFIANRLAYAMYREAAHLLELGVGDVPTIDRAFRNGLGLWATLCGPFRWIDITGGPSLYATAMAGMLPTLSQGGDVPAVFAEKQCAGERGTLNGRGFYDYEPGDAERWQKLLHEHAWEVRRLQQQYDPLGSDHKKE